MSALEPEKPAPQLRLPADYYCAPVSEQQRMFPRWVPIGCGTISVIVLIVLFAAGAFVNRGGSGRLLDWALGEMQHELIGMCNRDVKAAEKTDFTAEVATLRERMKARKVKTDALLPLLQSMRNAISDQQVTPAELDQLTTQIHTINSGR